MGVKFNPFTGNLDLIDTTAAAGLDGQVQFNNSGLLDGSADFTWDDTGKVLDVGGDINLDDGGSFQTTLQLVTPTAARTITFPDATGTVGLVAGSTGQLVFNNAGAYSGLSGVTTDGTDITLTGRFISSLNGAASAPPGAFTGTWFTGGTATTTKPQVLIEPTGTTSTAWSTSGTGLGVNAASGFAGNLLDLQVNGTSRAIIQSNGTLRLGSAPFNHHISYNSNVVDGALITGSAWQIQTPSSFGNQGFVIVDASNALPQFEVAPATGNCHIRGALGFGTTRDVAVLRDEANTLAQRNGTDAQTFCLYNTFTSATNFERLNARWTSNEAILDTEAGGAGGTLRGLKIGSAGTSLLGFYGATPAVQPAAVADITTTATAGTLPTPDGTVTIADATTPTVTELLEYCVELEAKLEAALGHLRTLGLIAT
jgi:hypothetical protein